MMVAAAAGLVLALAVAGEAGCAGGAGEQEPAGPEVTLRVKVPPEVAEQASRRVGGDAKAPVPILVIENVEVGAGEGLRLRVLGPPDPGGKRPVVGTASLVGAPQAELVQPVTRMTFSVPLTDAALPLIRSGNEVALALQVTGTGKRPPLKFERAYLKAGR